MDSADRKLVLAWGILVLLTLASFESAWGFAWLRNPNAAIVLVIGVALLKVRIVVMKFMEVGHAPLPLRLTLEVWIMAIAVAMLGLWYGIGR